MPKLSIAIIAFNEERIIGQALDSVKSISDEIIIVDSFSTDKTCEMAKSFGAKVIQEQWKGYAKQKNSALEKCTGDWILSLDADEVLTKDLREEIILAIKDPKDYQGFKIARSLFMGNKKIKWGGYYPDYQLRLVKNNIGARFLDREVHESISLDGKIGYLKSPLLHYAYESISEYQQALKKYAKLASAEISLNKANNPFLRAAWAFVYRYFFRLGFLHGDLGFQTVKAYSEYVYEKYYFAQERKYS